MTSTLETYKFAWVSETTGTLMYGTSFLTVLGIAVNIKDGFKS